MMRLDWFKFYPSDFLNSADVMMMGPAARGCYITLLSRCWLNAKNGGGIPDKTEYILAVCNCSEKEWATVKDAVLAKFNKENGQLFNPRIQEEMLEAQELVETKRVNAQNGWESRRNASASQSQSIRNGLHVHIDKIREDTEVDNTRADFQNLRSVYRNVVHKSCSSSSRNETQYLRFCKEYGEPDVLAACELWAEDNKWRDRKPDIHFFFSEISKWIESVRADKEADLAQENKQEENEAVVVAAIEAARIKAEEIQKNRHAEEEAEKKVIAYLRAHPNEF